MKVKNAAQVFSQRVSATMRYLASKGRFFYRNSFSVYLGMSLLGAGVPESAVDTADFLLFVDKLFDSVNGSSINPINGKLLRCAVKTNSPHLQFWEEALKVLNSVKCISKKKKMHLFPPVWKTGSILSGAYDICGLN
jgi:hypothetical protein